MPEIIYTGKEENLADILIERLIEEKKVDKGSITDIEVQCAMPSDDILHLWGIHIKIHTMGYSYDDFYYSKNCIEHGYRVTYLEHLYRMGVKEIKLKDIFKD